MKNKNNPSPFAMSPCIPARKKTLVIMVSAVLGTAPAGYAADQALEEIIVTALEILKIGLGRNHPR